MDVTAYAPLVNLPTDALNIIPWVGVANSATGPMPQNFWGKIGAVASGVVNTLLAVGQLAYKGLIALDNFFVAFGQAVADWGIRLVGAYLQASAAVRNAIQKTLEVLEETIRWAIQAAAIAIQASLGAVLDRIQKMFDRTFGSVVRDIVTALNSPEPQRSRSIARASSTVFLLVPAISLIPIAVRGAEAALQASTLGVSWGISKIVAKIAAEAIIRTLTFAALGLAVVNLFGNIGEKLGWVEGASLELARGAGLSGAIIASVSKVGFTFLKTVYWKELENRKAFARWMAFALSVIALAMVVSGNFLAESEAPPAGQALLAIDFVATVLSLVALWTYVKASARKHNQIIDVFSVIGKTMEKFVVFGAPAVAAGNLAFRLVTGEYNG